MPDTPTHYRHARVLLVDDHRTYRVLMGALLDKLGVRYQSCDDGREALHRFINESFDLVISDCCMPVMDGFAMTRALRRHEHAKGLATVPVLAFSAGLAPADIRRCMACGMNGWLPKPVSLGALDEVLRYWLAPSAAGGWRDSPSVLRYEAVLPSRASLIEAFGSWDVVDPLLFNLVQEAYEDLAVLTCARTRLDAGLTAQRLHRLMGGMAFLGPTGLELRAMQLISAVNQTGVALNAWALEQFQQDVESYLQRLSHL